MNTQNIASFRSFLSPPPKKKGRGGRELKTYYGINKLCATQWNIYLTSHYYIALPGKRPASTSIYRDAYLFFVCLIYSYFLPPIHSLLRTVIWDVKVRGGKKLVRNKNAAFIAFGIVSIPSIFPYVSESRAK